MKPIIKRIFDIIRIAEDCSDEEKYFNLFKDVLKNVSNVSHLVYSEPGELNLLQEVANRGLAKYVNPIVIDPLFGLEGISPTL